MTHPRDRCAGLPTGLSAWRGSDKDGRGSVPAASLDRGALGGRSSSAWLPQRVPASWEGGRLWRASASARSGKPRYDVNYREPDGRRGERRSEGRPTPKVRSDRRGRQAPRHLPRSGRRPHHVPGVRRGVAREPDSTDDHESDSSGRLRVHVTRCSVKMLAQIKPTTSSRGWRASLERPSTRASRSEPSRRSCRPRSMTSGSLRTRARPARCRRPRVSAEGRPVAGGASRRRDG